MYIQRKRGRRVYAGEDMPEATVAPEATDLLFEAEDVAELVAEVTEQPVEVEVAEDGDSVTFAVGEDVYTVEAEGDEEILESSRRNMRGKARVSASRSSRKPVKSSRVVRKAPSRRR